MSEKMNPSGIAWIGDIPESWSIKRVKYLATLKGRIGWQGLTSDEYIDEGPYLITGIDFKNGKVNWDNCVHISKERWEEATKIQIQNGDLLITKDGTVGKVAIVSGLNDLASLNSGVLVIRTNTNFDRKFLFWVLQSEEFWVWFRLKNAGNSTIIHLYQNDFAEFCYTYPKTAEQVLIADFLDEQCEKIDSIVTDLEKQINILQKYKKSLITETITKGLDKSVSIKDSGIKWIGEIPEHWEVKRIKYISSVHSSKRIFEEEYTDTGIPFFRTKEIAELANSKDISLELYISEKRFAQLKYNSVRKNDILVTSIGTIGEVWVSDGRDFYYKDGNITQIDGNSNFNSNFLKWELISTVFFDAIKFYESTTTISALTIEKIKEIYLPIPQNISEQIQIANYLDKQCSKIDSIIKSKKEQLAKITQHKKSFIYEYVTGKKRVKGANNNGN